NVLRLLQEEAMKENTAALHAQVPVEVATILMNEIRADIVKLESRLKVNLVLIPNKHFETQHYHIERIRYDDSRLDDPKTSIDLIEAPETTVTWESTKEKSEHNERPEALVKGISPDQPAPSAVKPQVVAQPQVSAAAAPSIGGMFQKILSWLAGPKAAAPAEPQKETSATEKTGARNTRSGSRTAASGERGERGGRNRRGDKRTSAKSEEEGENRRHPRGRQRKQDDSDSQDTVADSKAPASANAQVNAGAEDSGGRRRNRRGRGRNRRNSGDETEVTATAAVATDNAGQAQTAEAAPAETAPTPRRSRQGNAETAARPTPLEQDLIDDDSEEENDRSTEGEDTQTGDAEPRRRRRRSRRGRRQNDAVETTDTEKASFVPNEVLLATGAVATADAVTTTQADAGESKAATAPA